MARKLKVFRTPIGFHDAYVAAPSRKAALEAWGSERDLFARGIAEEITDPKLTRAPLAQPGTVFKVSRGDADAQFAALGEDKPKAKRATKVVAGKARQPRPDRAPLEEAEAALVAAERRHAQERRAIDAKIAALEAEGRRLQEKQDHERTKLEKTRASRDRAYRQAMERWQEE